MAVMLQPPDPTGLPARTPEQSARLRERMLPAWREATGVCRGLHGLMLGLAQPLEACGSPLPYHIRLHPLHGQPDQLDGSWSSSLLQWPLAPGQLDAVLMQLHPSWLPQLPELVAVAAQALGPEGRLVIALPGAELLDPWCQIGMPLLHLHGLTLQTAAWGDSRLLTRLPLRWRYHWHAGWQQWLGFADWSVQLWQKQVCTPYIPARRQARQQRAWTGIWLPQSRQPLHPGKDF